jgi:hypothetical protein
MWIVFEVGVLYYDNITGRLFNSGSKCSALPPIDGMVKGNIDQAIGLEPIYKIRAPV